MKKISPGLTVKFTSSLLIVAAVICSLACSIGYWEFTAVLEKQYNDMAYDIACTARGYVDGDHITEYLETGIKDPAYEHTKEKLDSLLLTMEARYIYVAAVDKRDYRTLTYIFDASSPNSEIPPYQLLDVSKDIREEYADSVKTIMTTGERVDDYFYSYSEKFGPHTTAAVPIYDSQGKIVAMLSVEKAMSTLQQARGHYVFVVLAVTLIVVVFCSILYILYTYRVMIKPVIHITKEAKDFVERESSANGAVDTESVLSQIRNKDEIGTLARAIARMETDISSYITNLTAVTAEKERIGTELNIASKIQMDMLPCIFPAFPGRDEFEIYAAMMPAKEVGGDFYDYFLTDEDHLVIVMADVSGKGVPAALFMVIAKTLLKNSALSGMTAGEIAEKVNRQLCENNDTGMFVTVWLGILTISTGHLTYINAGHEYTAVMRDGGVYELVKEDHGFVMGGLEGISYKEYEMELEQGDRLFLYTDGVAEAANASNELYGTDRMLSALNRTAAMEPQETVDRLKKDIDGFAGDAPQFDDITMLSFYYMKKRVQDMDLYDEENKHEITVTADIGSLDTVTDFVNDRLKIYGCPDKTMMQIDVIIDELFGNIAYYAYPQEPGDVTVGVQVIQEKTLAAVITFTDHGIPYNPLEREDPDTSLSAQERKIGGLGIFIVKSSADDIFYEYAEGRNVLRVKRAFDREGEDAAELN